LKKQEARKEVKAAKAANIEAAVEQELLSRLRSGTYGDIYNFPMAHFNKALDAEKAAPDGAADAEAEGVKDGGDEELDEDAIAETDVRCVCVAACCS
jgi:protein MAK16